MEIKIKHNRKGLEEGRNYGIGYAILKKIKNNQFETASPFSACKDYLNDLIFVEQTKVNLPKIYGFKHKYQNLFNNKRFFYMGIKTLPILGSGVFSKFEECENALINNVNNLVELINQVEEIMGSKSRTSLYTICDNTLIFRIPLIWAKNPPSISFYTLFIRCFFDITPTDFKENINETINSRERCFIKSDTYFLKSIKQFFNKKAYKKLNQYKFNTKVENKYDIHDFGIVSFLSTV